MFDNADSPMLVDLRLNGLFEPRESHKGNVARAIFYFYTMYQEDALEADPDFFESQRATLCEWHGKDPVDLAEWERTFMIAGYQDDSPNPFVLDCTLAYRSYCQGFSSDCENSIVKDQPSQPQIRVYPNPVADELQVVSAGDNALRMVDMLGRIHIEQEFTDEIALDVSSLETGIYFVWIHGTTFRVMKL